MRQFVHVSYGIQFRRILDRYDDIVSLGFNQEKSGSVGNQTFPRAGKILPVDLGHLLCFGELRWLTGKFP